MSSSFSKKSVLARVKEEEQEGKRKAILFILLPQGANRVFAIGKGGFGGQRADFSAQERRFGGKRKEKQYRNHEEGCKKVVKMRKKS